VTDSLARRVLLSLLSVVLFLVLTEGVLSWAYAFVKTREAMAARERPEQKHALHDAELGWTNQPSRVVRDLYGPGKHFTSSAQGFRAREEYSTEVPAGRRRIVFAGDSFTMGFGVGDEETYPAQLERLDARLQSVNLGMGAYGADQAFLRVRRDARGLAKNLIVFAFIAHDFRRMELDYYMAPKPRLALANGKLEIENAPVPERDAGEEARLATRQFLGWLDLGKALTRAASWLRPKPSRETAESAGAAPDGFPFAPVADAMFAELASLARAENSALLLVYLPSRGELLTAEQPVRDWTAHAAGARAIPFFDASPAFRGRDPTPLFGLDAHYSEAGNALVAQALLPEVLRLTGLVPIAEE
jgi:hypothetical protein